MLRKEIIYRVAHILACKYWARFRHEVVTYFFDSTCLPWCEVKG